MRHDLSRPNAPPAPSSLGGTPGAGVRGRWARKAQGVAGIAVLVVVALLGSARVPSDRTGTVEVVYGSVQAYALASRRADTVRTIPALRLVERRAANPVREAVRLRSAPGVAAARATVARTSAGGPPITLGLASTPAGGAYEWQWYATGMDQVPATVLAAAARTTIAIVDTGVDTTAPSLAGKIAGTRDVRSRRGTVTDSSGHGTFVASLAAGRGDGGVAGFGGAARLLVVKVGDSATLNDVDVAAGILYAVDHGARIVNVSIAGQTRSAAEAGAVAYAARKGVLIVAAVGNDGLGANAVTYPAALVPLAVGASDAEGRRAPFSGHGSFLSLVAPGAAVFGAVPAGLAESSFGPVTLPGSSRGAYAFASGTSYAAPEVAGAAALVWAANPALTARQVATILEQTGSGHGSWNEDLGYGLLDAGAAVRAALQTRT